MTKDDLLREIRNDFAVALESVQEFLKGEARPNNSREFKYFEERQEHFSKRITQIDEALATGTCASLDS